MVVGGLVHPGQPTSQGGFALGLTNTGKQHAQTDIITGGQTIHKEIKNSSCFAPTLDVPDKPKQVAARSESNRPAYNNHQIKHSTISGEPRAEANHVIN